MVDNAIAIAKQKIDKLRCADGSIDIVRYEYFERLLKGKSNSGNSVSLHDGPVFYAAPASRVAEEAFQSIPCNLIIKTTKLASFHA